MEDSRDHGEFTSSCQDRPACIVSGMREVQFRGEDKAFGLGKAAGACASLVLVVCSCAAQGKLETSFGPKGLERVSYAGEQLLDVDAHPEDEFHIWHMRLTDLEGRVRSDGAYGWGETNQGREWDSVSKAWRYQFPWGTIRAQYRQVGDTLDVKVIENNKPSSGVVFYGATVYPMAMHVSGRVTDAAIVDSEETPAVSLARWGKVSVAAIVADSNSGIWSGWQQRGPALQAIVSQTLPDALPASAARRERGLRPGETASFTLSLRFGQETRRVENVAADAFESFAARWPAGATWQDRRLIGTVFLASSPQGEKTRPGGFPQNPRRYFNDAGLAVRGGDTLQRRVLEQATEVVANLKRMQAQGAITWDIEGEQYPQDTSYVCSPDKIAELAPEMEEPVRTGSYKGLKLDDAYFKIIHDAGFRVGICVRPQRFTTFADGSARQVSLDRGQVVAELKRKIGFAHQRWGATLFYLDSMVEADGRTLPAAVLEEVAAAFPDCLLIPEQSTPRSYRMSAPFLSFLFHGDTGSTQWVRALYPHAFAVNLVNDADGAKLAAHRAQLVDSVRHGDVLMVHVDHWHRNNDEVLQIYKEAGLAQRER